MLMGLLEKLKAPDINTAYDEYLECEDALLLDVRTVEEYAAGHIPNSVNIPLNDLGKVEEIALDYHTKIFVYCLSGIRSRKARTLLMNMGYINVVNMGAFSSYKGTIEK